MRNHLLSFLGEESFLIFPAPHLFVLGRQQLNIVVEIS